MKLVEAKADYWRNRDGSVVHTNDCLYSGSLGSVPWHWADGMTEGQVAFTVERVEWLSLCKKCWPGAGIGDTE